MNIHRVVGGCRMGKIFEFLGMSVAVVKEEDSNHSRRKLFAADITYTTAANLCFTYLFDNTAVSEDFVVSPPADLCLTFLFDNNTVCKEFIVSPPANS